MKSEGPNLGVSESNFNGDSRSLMGTLMGSLMGTQGKSIGIGHVVPFILILPLLPRLSAILGWS